MWAGETAMNYSRRKTYLCLYFHGPYSTNVKQIFNSTCTFDRAVVELM